MTRIALFNPPCDDMAKGTIRASWPVAASVLDATARSVNWLLARGVPLVIDGGHSFQQLGPGLVTKTLHYRYQPNEVHHTLGATFVLSADRYLAVSVNGTEYTVGNSIPVVVHQAFPNLAGNAEIAWAPTFSWDPGSSSTGFYIHQISLYECPVFYLADDYGCDGIGNHTQVYDGWVVRKSISGIARALDSLRDTYFCRGTLFNYARTDVRTTGFVDVWDNVVTLGSSGYGPNVQPVLQNRLMYQGEIVRTARCSVYAHVSNGSTGYVRVRMGSDAFATFTLTNNTAAWQTSRPLDIETDDASRWDTDGGIRGGDRDSLQIEIKVDASDQLIYLRGVSIWDPPG